MDFSGWFTLLVVLAIFIALLRSWAQPDLLFVAAAALLAAVGIITPNQAFAGFSNPGVLAVAMLFVVAAGLRETGILDLISHHVLGPAKSVRQVQLRLAAVVLPMSAFLNNTPIVAMFVPVVLDWSRRNSVSPSKLLIPLSYLAILGGTCTLIGTSTNLVVNGLLISSGQPGMGLLEIGRIGLPYAMIGLAYLIFLGPRWLPERKELMEQLGESRREYLAEMMVCAGCRLIGQTIEGAGLRRLPGLFVIEIDRGGQIISPVRPDHSIELNDRLVFTGIVSSIIDLEKIPGLVPAGDPNYEVAPQQQRQRRLCEAVISESSPLVAKTIREADFRSSYGAAVVAVHRGGRRIAKKIGDITLLPGDTLLMQVEPRFFRAYRHDPAFYLVSNVEEYRPLRRDRAWVAVAIFVLLLTAMIAGLLDTLVASALAASAMVISGCLSMGDARRSVEWQVLITISAAFGVGQAMENTGLAAWAANYLVQATQPLGPVVTLAAIYVVGSILTELITNNAAAILLFPICLETARMLGIDYQPLVIALILSASASFMTPIGYQTNMMVFGPGGYRFSDFLRFGGPLNLLLLAAAMFLIPILWPF